MHVSCGSTQGLLLSNTKRAILATLIYYLTYRVLYCDDYVKMSKGANIARDLT